MNVNVLRIIVLLLFVLVLLGGLGYLLSLSGGAVSRARVARFARRQQVQITSGNGNIVIRYLATTRRWRVTGLVVGLVASVAASVPRGSVNIGFLWLFAGWFVGAIIAEWQISTADDGARRAALLVPRRRADYLTWPVRRLTDGVVVATIALGVAAVVRSFAAGQDDHRLRSALMLAVATAVVLVLAAVQRQVLTRRQPVAEVDVLAADDAIRARSLRVLAGATVALLGFVAADLVPQVGMARAEDVSFVLTIVALIVGWLVAIGSSRVVRPLPDGERSAVGAQQ